MFGGLTRCTAGMLALSWGCFCGSSTRAEHGVIVLAPHRAVYDFSLGKTRDHFGVVAVAGRLVYELTGSVCEGYTEKLRVVTQMTNEDGEETTADERTSTWEESAGKRFRFDLTATRNGKSVEDTPGEAVRSSAAENIAVELKKPAEKVLSLPARAYFPTQHTIALLTAARTGRASFDADVYDGSEHGEKFYHAISSIGALIPHAAVQKLASVENAERFRHLAAWPIRIAYFDPKLDKEDAMPAYEMRSVFYENGVNEKMVMDYGSYEIEGELKEIVFFEPTKCD
jgi:hypothetical protein